MFAEIVENGSLIIIKIVLAFLSATAISFYSVPLFRKAALKYGVLDRPNTPLKNQKDAIPYFGGLAIYVAFLAGVSISYEFSQPVLAILLGATLILLLGLVDDFGVLTPMVKLTGQILTTLILIKAGVYIQISILPIWLNILLTLLWVVGITNSINIIDIMDGLASTVALVICFAILFFALWNGNIPIAIMTLALAGGIVGFLYYNWQPARIYLGDTGSMFIGYMLAALAMNNTYADTNHLAVLAPILILGVPIFETTFVSIMRIRKGRLPLFGSPDHYALRMKKMGYTAPTIVLFSALVTFVLSVLAVSISLTDISATLIILAFVLICSVSAGIWLARVDIEYPPDL